MDGHAGGDTLLDEASQDGANDIIVIDPILPVQRSMKRQKCADSVDNKDKIKWVGKVPFVQSGATGKIHCGNCVMYKEHVEGTFSRILCCNKCCIMDGQAYGGLCECFCHLLAKEYSQFRTRH